MEMIHNIPRLASRMEDSHKGTFGRVLVIGGSLGLSGAAVLAGKSALRSGAGLVKLAVPESVLPIVATLEPCYTTLALPEDNNGQISLNAIVILQPHLKEHDVVCFGPGAGTSPGIREMLQYLLACEDLTMVVDADGLNALCRMPDWINRKKAKVILTPHPGEMRRLWKSIFRKTIPKSRQDQAKDLAELTNTVVVLKGTGTVVTDSKWLYINKTGNPGMATAGSGDVLTGIMGALIGQGMSLFDAAILGVYIHGLAGDLAAGRKGQVSLIATDIIDFLPDAFRKHC